MFIFGGLRLGLQVLLENVFSLWPFSLSKTKFYLEISLHRPWCNVTIVTAYYSMRSKHSKAEYLSWMSNFLSLQDCMVIFTQKDFVSTIQSLRPAFYQNQTIIISIELNQEYEDIFFIFILSENQLVVFLLLNLKDIDWIDIRRWFLPSWVTLSGQSRRVWTLSRISGTVDFSTLSGMRRQTSSRLLLTRTTSTPLTSCGSTLGQSDTRSLC